MRSARDCYLHFPSGVKVDSGLGLKECLNQASIPSIKGDRQNDKEQEENA